MIQKKKKNPDSNDKIRNYRKARRILKKRRLGILWALAQPLFPVFTLLWFLKKKSFLIFFLWLSAFLGYQTANQQTKEYLNHYDRSRQEIHKLNQNIQTQGQKYKELEDKLQETKEENGKQTFKKENETMISNFQTKLDQSKKEFENLQKENEDEIKKFQQTKYESEERKKELESFHQVNQDLKKNLEELQIKFTKKKQEVLESFTKLEQVRKDVESIRTKLESVENLRKSHIIFMALDSLLNSPAFRRIRRNCHKTQKKALERLLGTSP